MLRLLCSAPHHRSRLQAVAPLAIVLLAVASTPAAAQDPLLWGSLKPGPHAVGYRSLFQLDHTREYDPDYLPDSAVPAAHKARPILICIWYPAQKTSAKPMEYRQYLEVSSDDPRIAPFVKRLSRHLVAGVSDGTVGMER